MDMTSICNQVAEGFHSGDLNLLVFGENVILLPSSECDLLYLYLSNLDLDK